MSEGRSEQDVSDWVQVDGKKHYHPIRYLRPKHMASIGYQFQLIVEYFQDCSVLEVGVGTGLTAELLRQVGHVVTTLDVDEKLRPDILASVTDIPSSDAEFGAFACFEVLEHLPWDRVAQALRELNRVSQFGGVLSVPTVEPKLLLQRHNERGHSRPVIIPIGIRRRRSLKHSGGEHYWELGANRSAKELCKQCESAGFTVVRRFVAPENMYHYFFVLKKCG